MTKCAETKLEKISSMVRQLGVHFEHTFPGSHRTSFGFNDSFRLMLRFVHDIYDIWYKCKQNYDIYMAINASSVHHVCM